MQVLMMSRGHTRLDGFFDDVLPRPEAARFAKPSGPRPH